MSVISEDNNTSVARAVFCNGNLTGCDANKNNTIEKFENYRDADYDGQPGNSWLDIYTTYKIIDKYHTVASEVEDPKLAVAQLATYNSYHAQQEKSIGDYLAGLAGGLVNGAVNRIDALAKQLEESGARVAANSFYMPGSMQWGIATLVDAQYQMISSLPSFVEQLPVYLATIGDIINNGSSENAGEAAAEIIWLGFDVLLMKKAVSGLAKGAGTSTMVTRIGSGGVAVQEFSYAGAAVAVASTTGELTVRGGMIAFASAGKSGGGTSISDEELAGKLEKYNGNRMQTANDPDVPISCTTLSKRIENSQPGSPLYKFKALKGERGKLRIIVDEQELANILEEYHGNRTQASQDPRVYVSHNTIGRIIEDSLPESPLHKFKELKGKGGEGGRRPRIIVDEQELASILEEYHGSRKRAFQDSRVNVSRETIRKMIEDSSPESPLHKFKELKGKGGEGGRRPRIIVDEQELANILEEYHGSRNRASQDPRVNVSRETIRKMIEDSPPESPLHKFKELKSEGGKPLPSINEQELASILEEYDGNRRGASRDLRVKLSRGTIGRIIEASSSESPLYKFKELKGGK